MEQTSEAKLKIEDTSKPDASGWSREMDRLLLQRRGEMKLPWKAIAPLNGMSAAKCQNRFKLLTSDGGRAAPREARATAAEAAVIDRDGLDWLVRKNKITLRQRLAGEYYRRCFRDAGDLSVKSCLNVVEGGPGPGRGGAGLQGALAGNTAAKRALFELRWLVLGGQDDLVTVCDGICGVGHTPRSLAGGDGSDASKRRQAVLEATLCIALDLVARALDEGAKGPPKKPG